MRYKEELKDLLIRAGKEYGEICECIVKGDGSEYWTTHWVDELGDLSICVKSMCELAGITFDNACEIGIRRKREKLQEFLQNKSNIEQSMTESKCLYCNSVNVKLITFTPDSKIYQCYECDKKFEL